MGKKQVVGWGVMLGDEICQDKVACKGDDACCYVCYDGDMIPACKKCASQSKIDRVAETLALVFG